MKLKDVIKNNQISINEATLTPEDKKVRREIYTDLDKTRKDVEALITKCEGNVKKYVSKVRGNENNDWAPVQSARAILSDLRNILVSIDKAKTKAIK